MGSGKSDQKRPEAFQSTTRHTSKGIKIALDLSAKICPEEVNSFGNNRRCRSWSPFVFIAYGCAVFLCHVFVHGDTSHQKLRTIVTKYPLTKCYLGPTISPKIATAGTRFSLLEFGAAEDFLALARRGH
jgi:hypothetical protein